MDGRAQISAYSKKRKRKEHVIATTFVAPRRGEGALASDDSMRFGTATRADTSVEEEEVEVEGGAARGRSENRQKLSALTSSE
jgi:hypothetical protein